MQDLKILVNKITKIFNTNLKAIYLEEIKDGLFHKNTLLTLLLIIDTFDLNEMNNLLKTNLIKNKFSLKIFTVNELTNSLDVFPIEFLEIKENYNLIHGENIIAKLDIKPKNLRLECEFYLRTNLLKLREGYILNNKNLTRLIRESLSHFLIIFKYLLFVYNLPLVSDKLAIITSLKKKIEINEQLFMLLFNNFSKQKLNTYFAEYLLEIENIIHQVDLANV